MAHVEYRIRPELSRPVMVCAFGGWNDGGEAATTAVRTLRTQWGARRFAEIDPEEFYDFQVHRPTVRLVEGSTRRIDWPASRFFSARINDRDAIVFVGVEPNTRWRTYAETILQVCADMDVSLLVTLGAFLADVAHTRPAPVNAASEDEDWLAKPGIVPARYEGPTGIVGVLTAECIGADLPTASLWAAVPTYVPTAPSPKAALALLERTAEVLGMWVPTTDLEIAAAAYERQVSELVQEDEETSDYVTQLEERVDSDEGTDAGGAARSLVEEVERYLRDRKN